MEERLREEYEIIDLETWGRREHFTFFRKGGHSNYGVTVQQDISPVIRYRQGEQAAGRAAPLSTMLYFLVMKAVHRVPELCLRMVDGRPVRFKRLHPSFTYIPKGQELHCNCVAPYDDDFALFVKDIETKRAASDSHPSLSPEGGAGQNLIYLTVVNHIAFTAVSNPWGDTLTDTVPRVAFGKIDEGDGRWTIPLSIEVLHEFVDGIHLSKFYEEFARLVQDAENTFAVKL